MRPALVIAMAVAVFGCATAPQMPPPPPKTPLGGPEGAQTPPPPPGESSGQSEPAAFVGDQVVAEVNGHVITKEDLFQRLIHSGGKRALDDMIFEILVRDKAKEMGITVSDDEIKAKLDEQRQRFPTQDAMDQYMKQAGMTMDDLRERIKTDLLAQKIARVGLEVSDEEIKDYFDKYGSRLGQPERFRISVIQTDTLEQAEEAKKQLDGGADFAEVAKKLSKHVSAEKGGDLGLLTLPNGRVPPPVDKAVRSLSVGDVAGPIKTDRGFFIVKLTDKKEAQKATLEGSRERIRDILTERKVSARTWRMRSSLREKADVKVYLE